MNKEEWKVIDGFPNYEVSNIGRVRNVKTGRIRKPSKGNRGYFHFGLRDFGLRDFGILKSLNAHLLVILTFVGPRPKNMVCRHLDGNRQNNHVENLKWGTPSENSLDKVAHGRHPNQHGEKSVKSKLTDKDVLGIRKAYTNGKGGELARKYNVCCGSIFNIIHRKTWTHI